MATTDALLGRMRANAGEALAQGATVSDVAAHLLAVTRGVSRPTATEVADGADVAELVETLNGFRSTPSRGGVDD